VLSFRKKVEIMYTPLSPDGCHAEHFLFKAAALLRFVWLCSEKSRKITA